MFAVFVQPRYLSLAACMDQHDRLESLRGDGLELRIVRFEAPPQLVTIDPFGRPVFFGKRHRSRSLREMYRAGRATEVARMMSAVVEAHVGRRDLADDRRPCQSIKKSRMRRRFRRLISRSDQPALRKKMLAGSGPCGCEKKVVNAVPAFAKPS